MFKLNDSYTFSYAKYANTDERLNVYTRHGLLSFNMTRATFDRFIEFIKSIKFQTDFERLETIVDQGSSRYKFVSEHSHPDGPEGMFVVTISYDMLNFQFEFDVKDILRFAKYVSV